MPDYRSPPFLLVIGGTFVALSIGAWLFTGESNLTWICMLIAIPPFVEWEVSHRSGWIAKMVYRRNASEIERQAYSPIGSLLRCCFMFLSFSLVFILGQGGLNLLPDDHWRLPMILGPAMIYVIWAGTAYRRNILSVAKQEGWQRRKAAKINR